MSRMKTAIGVFVNKEASDDENDGGDGDDVASGIDLASDLVNGLAETLFACLFETL